MALISGNQFATYPPSGFDRADGEEGRPGTSTPPDSIMTFPVSYGGPPYFFEEESDSPEIERAEQGTIVHKFKCDPDTAYALIGSIGRGYTFVDSAGNESRVVNSRMAFSRGNVCSVIITAESLNWDWPPDEFSLEVTELNPSLAKHPRYNLLSYYDRFIVGGNQQAEAPEYAEMYQNIINSFPTSSVQVVDGIVSNPRIQAQELAFKLHKAEDSFYLPGFRIQFSQYFSIPVTLNPGGYIEDLILSGNLPYYFWNVDTPQTTNINNTIFSDLAIYNSTIYSGGISWLRLCDTIQYQRTWFRRTSTWQGGPIGHWDNEIYNQLNQPYQTSEDEGTVLRP